MTLQCQKVRPGNTTGAGSSRLGVKSAWTFEEARSRVLIIALAILVLQAHRGPSELRASGQMRFSILWPYLVAIGLSLVYAFLRAPFDLDSERAQRIEGLLSTIPTPVSVVFERVDVTIYNGRERPSVIVLRLLFERAKSRDARRFDVLKLWRTGHSIPTHRIICGATIQHVAFAIASSSIEPTAILDSALLNWDAHRSGDPRIRVATGIFDAHETRIVSIPPDLLSISRVGAR